MARDIIINNRTDTIKHSFFGNIGIMMESKQSLEPPCTISCTPNETTGMQQKRRDGPSSSTSSSSRSRSSSRSSSRSRSRSSASSSSRSQARVERLRRKYHKMALKIKLKPITEETVQQRESKYVATRGGHRLERHALVNEAKQKIIAELTRSGGDPATPAAQAAIETLVANHRSKNFDPRKLVCRPDCGRTTMMMSDTGLQLEDTWITLTKPLYQDCMGVNANQDCMYTMGRMTFGTLAQDAP